MNNAEMQDQDITDLLRIARHAVQAQLAIISEKSGLILFEKTDETSKTFLNDVTDIHNSAQILSGLLDTLWQMIEANTRYSRRESVDLRIVIERARARALASNSREVVTDIPDSLPAVIVNAEALEEAIRILLTRITPHIDGSITYLSVSTSESSAVINVETHPDAHRARNQSVGEFLRPRENLSVDLLCAWSLIRQQNGHIQLMGDSSAPNLCFRLSFPLS